MREEMEIRNHANDVETNASDTGAPLVSAGILILAFLSRNHFWSTGIAMLSLMVSPNRQVEAGTQCAVSRFGVVFVCVDHSLVGEKLTYPTS